MIDKLLKIASELKSKEERERFINRINKISEDLASKDYLLIEIKEMESIYDSSKIDERDTDKDIDKIILEK